MSLYGNRGPDQQRGQRRSEPGEFQVVIAKEVRGPLPRTESLGHRRLARRVLLWITVAVHELDAHASGTFTCAGEMTSADAFFAAFVHMQSFRIDGGLGGNARPV